MPWTIKQEHLFQAAAHNPAFAAKVGIPQAKAATMASEGIKPSKALKTVQILKSMGPPSG